MADKKKGWMEVAIEEELLKLLDEFEFKSTDQESKAEMMAKVMDKALELWDEEGDENFGMHATKMFFVLMENPKLREQMGLN